MDKLRYFLVFRAEEDRFPAYRGRRRRRDSSHFWRACAVRRVARCCHCFRWLPWLPLLPFLPVDIGAHCHASLCNRCRSVGDGSTRSRNSNELRCVRQDLRWNNLANDTTEKEQKLQARDWSVIFFDYRAFRRQVSCFRFLFATLCVFALVSVVNARLYIFEQEQG